MRWLTFDTKPGPKKRGSARRRKPPRGKATRGKAPHLVWRLVSRLLPTLTPRFKRELARKAPVRLAGLTALAAVAGLIGSGWAGRQLDALAEGLGRASATAGLAVEEVFVEGRARSGRESLLNAVGVSLGDPILAFDPQAAKARLEELTWVRQATVERRLPSVLYLRLEERHPLALWQVEGRIAVIDETGTVIDGARPEDFAELTLVVGPDAPDHARALLTLLDSEPALRRQVIAAVRVGGRRWNLRFRGGTDVRLPESGAEAAWAQFARIERQHGVLQRDVESIDLRLPDRLVVRGAPEKNPEPADDDGKNT